MATWRGPKLNAAWKTLYLSATGLCVALFMPLASAQRGGASPQGPPYSKSPEYQHMLEEIRSAAPSPAYIATGKRPQGDAHLQVEVRQEPTALHLETRAAQITFDENKGELTVRDRASQGTWTLALDATAACVSGRPPVPATGDTIKTLGHNHWNVGLRTVCDSATFDVEALDEGLLRVTLQAPGPSAKAGEGAEVMKLRLHVRGGGPFFGLGERFWQASLSATTLDVRPQDRYGEPGHNWTYVAVPLVYTASGLGLYADTAFDAKFRFNEADTSFDIEFAGSPVPVYLFAEANPKGVMSAYTAITGRPQDPPFWAFGPWITALGGKGAVLDTAERIRAEGMPASALWVFDENEDEDNVGWPFWFSSYYGDARKFTDILHGQGFKVLSYVHPYVRSTLLPYTKGNPQFGKGISDKLLVMGADGKPAGPRFEPVPVGNVDFTNPAAVDWWQGMITQAVDTQGFDGWMEDFGEWVRDTDRFSAGSGRTLSELYPLLYHKITTQVAQGINPEVVSFSRSGSPGSQHFSPVLWGGDQSANWSRDYGLPAVVTAGITAGMSGFSNWGPDILSTGSDRDLWMRWVEFGALTPVMRDHVWDKPNGSLNVFTDAATTAYFRQWAAFHSSLLPYFVTYAAEAQRTGVPIMRHTVLEYPDDPRSATAEYQYLLGREMLIAPVVQSGQRLRTLYLPKGEWVNFWSGDFLTGGQDVTVDASVIPILVRAGSVLPFKPEKEAGSWNWEDPQLLDGPLIWKVYPSITGVADGNFTLSDGTSAHFQQHGSGASVDGSSKSARSYEIILRTKAEPTAIRLNGVPFARLTKGSGKNQSFSQWWWNPSTTEVHVIFRSSDFRLEFEGIVLSAYDN